MEHAYFSPSASPRWIPCPASLFLSESIQQKTSTYAHEGVICHDIAAQCLTKNIAVSDFAGKIVEGVSMTPELIDAMQMYIDEIRGLTKEYGASGGKIEHKVTLTEHCWGTTDALLWNKDTAIICDLKMGKGVIVSANNNSQMKLYSVGSLKWLDETHNLKPAKIINIIIQPRTVNPIRKYEMSRDELASWYVNEVVPIFKELKPGHNSGQHCNPGETQCRWCPVSATCAAQANKMVNDAQTAFTPFTKVEAPAPLSKVEGQLTIEETVGYKKFFKHIQNWMNTIEEFLMVKALAGDSIPGFKLVEGRSNRQWKADENQVVDFLRQLNAEPYIQKLVSPTQAEKALGKKVAKEQELDKLITKPPGSPTLVLESDTRPAMQMNVETEFEEFVDVDNDVEILVKSTETLLVDSPDDGKEIDELSALQRMRMAEDEDEIEPEETLKEIAEEKDTPEKNIDDLFPEDKQHITEELIETATGGDPVSVESVVGNGNPKPPKESTKRYQVLNFGKGGVTLQNAAAALGCGINMIKMHLKYLNERDGYSYEIYSDDTFKVY